MGVVLCDEGGFSTKLFVISVDEVERTSEDNTGIGRDKTGYDDEEDTSNTTGVKERVREGDDTSSGHLTNDEKNSLADIVQVLSTIHRVPKHVLDAKKWTEEIERGDKERGRKRGKGVERGNESA